MDGCAFAEELGVRDDSHIVTLQDALNHSRRTDRHGRLVHDDRPRLQHWADFSGGLFDVRQVSAAIVILRRRDAQEHDVGYDRRLRSADDKPQVARCDGGVNDLGQSRFDDWDLARRQTGDLVSVDIGTHHLKSEVGKTRSSRQPDVSGAHDTEHGGFRSEIS